MSIQWPISSTPTPGLDFETYSEAGLIYRPDLGYFERTDTKKTGIGLVGTWAYTEHPSTEITVMAYDLLDGFGPRQWVPGMPFPEDLRRHIAAGGPLSAWNSLFEYGIWHNVGVRRYGFPPLPLDQLRDTMAKSLANGWPQALGKAAAVCGAQVQKDAEGQKAMLATCQPRKPTKKDPRLRLTPQEDPQVFNSMYRYNALDVLTEAACGDLMCDLSPMELEIWKLDQRINVRGVQIDVESVEALIRVLEQVTVTYTGELRRITGGAVNTVSEQKRMCEWLATRGVRTNSVDADHVKELLKRTDIGGEVRRVLEIRQALSSIAVKKLYALKHQVCADGRLRGSFIYHGAGRTGRWTGGGPQPHNMPSSGPKTYVCRHGTIGNAPHCWHCDDKVCNPVEWGEDVIDRVCTYARLGWLPRAYGPDTLDAIAGSIRGLFVAAPGHDLICSDFSAIEAVVLAMIAGEEWRIEVFRTHGKIYEMSAASITGVPFSEIMAHKETTGEHHPLRKTIGKVAELASGYQGSVGAWKAFGADEFMSDDEILAAVRKWRQASPNIVKLWYGLEDAAVNAVGNPGQWFTYRGVGYCSHDNKLICHLPSGRYLTYQRPRLVYNKFNKLAVQFEGYNSDSSKGPVGWMTFDTYGGKLTENVVQATARDILAHSMLKLEAAGYRIVLHVHDEIVVEVPEGQGSVEEVERIMATMPPWAADWPIKASGGWRGRRYRK